MNYLEEIKALDSMVKEDESAGKIKKNTIEYDLRTKKILNLYLKHKTYNEISKELDVSIATVRSTVKELINKWQKEDTNRLQSARWAEYHKINLIEAEAWEAFEASRKKPKTVVLKAGSSRVLRDAAGNLLNNGEMLPTSRRVESTEEERYSGDWTFMETIKWCSKARRELLGLDMPKKIVETADIEGTKSKAEFDKNFVTELIEKYKREALNSVQPQNFIDAEIEESEVPESHRLTVGKDEKDE